MPADIHPRLRDGELPALPLAHRAADRDDSRADDGYQDTPYFAAIRRAFSSSVSRRLACFFLAGLDGCAVVGAAASGVA